MHLDACQQIDIYVSLLLPNNLTKSHLSWMELININVRNSEDLVFTIYDFIKLKHTCNNVQYLVTLIIPKNNMHNYFEINFGIVTNIQLSNEAT